LSSEELIRDSELVAIKRLILAMRRETVPFPPIVTHNMIDGDNDPVLEELRRVNLINAPSDRVKVVYHPEFLTSQSPILAMEYEDFVQGCHLGVFPSYYEPWGYTPAECAIAGIPSVTSNLSGFGCYIEELVKNPSESGIFIVDRRLKGVEESVQQLSDYLATFCHLGTRQRAHLRAKTERLGEQLLDWSRVSGEYEKARFLALSRVFPDAFRYDTKKMANGGRPTLNLGTEKFSSS